MGIFDIMFLGTCACDFSNKLENEFKDAFDFDARRASALLINKNCLIDSGMHILDSLRIAKNSKDDITNIFITHLHEDHFNYDNIKQIAQNHKIRLWIKNGAQVKEADNIEIIRMTPFEKYEVEDGLYITGLDANHDPISHPQHFLIEKQGKKIFYGCDGAWLLANTYNYLKRTELDLAILDATIGDYDGDYRIAEHNSIPMIRLMLPTLKNEKIIVDKTNLYLSHIAPSLHKTHKEIELIANELGARVAYDGLKITI